MMQVDLFPIEKGGMFIALLDCRSVIHLLRDCPKNDVGKMPGWSMGSE